MLRQGKIGKQCWVQALWCCRQLLDLNPDNYRYHDGLREALGLAVPQALNSQSQAETWSDEQRHLLQELYAELAEKYPRSNSPRRIPLDFLVPSLLQPAQPASCHITQAIKHRGTSDAQSDLFCNLHDCHGQQTC